MVDPYEVNRSTGAFLLVDESSGATVAAGMVAPRLAVPTLDVTGLPLLLDVTGRRVLVVGAGAVAARRIAALLEAGARGRGRGARRSSAAVAELGVPVQPARVRSRPTSTAPGWSSPAPTTPAVNAAVAAAAERGRHLLRPGRRRRRRHGPHPGGAAPRRHHGRRQRRRRSAAGDGAARRDRARPRPRRRCPTARTGRPAPVRSRWSAAARATPT